MSMDPNVQQAIVQARHEALHRAARGSSSIRLAPLGRSLLARLPFLRRRVEPTWHVEACRHGTVAVWGP
jgi:hypothetical protein